jgi:hypothetical protein
MFRKAAAKKKLGAREGFVWRGTEITRIEGLSDAVFGFAIALLIVSTEVPKTYDELILTLKGFFAFAVCFTLLMGIWYKHYLYFRRYNLEDFTSVILTMVLLFLVLFYTYPLKYLFMAFIGPSGPQKAGMITSYHQLSRVFTVYGLGFIAVYAIFGILYRHAYRMREELHLTELEIWDTKHELRESFMSCGIGVASIAFANIVEGEWIGLAGSIYGLMGFVGWWHGNWSRNRRKEIHARLYPESTVATL